METKTQNEVKSLIKRYETLLEKKKLTNSKNQNDLVEGLINAYEDIIDDLKKVLNKK
jgi:hypothetical protein